MRRDLVAVMKQFGHKNQTFLKHQG